MESGILILVGIMTPLTLTLTGTRGGVDAFANNEKVRNRLQEWLVWTKAGGTNGLEAKPKKWIAAGFRNGEVVDRTESVGEWRQVLSLVLGAR